MYNKNTYYKNTFWTKDFIKDVTIHHNKDKVAQLLWSDDENNIIEQVEELLKNSHDLILSEILPHEIPDMILPDEINQIGKVLQYIPPQVIEHDSEKTRKEDITKIIYDENSKNQRLYESICTIDKFKAINIEQNNDIYEVIDNEDNFIFIDAINPYISHFLILYCIKNKIKFKIRNENKSFHIRCILSGLIITEDLNYSKSVRSLFYDINNNDVNHEIFDLNIAEEIVKIKNWNDFKKIRNDSFYSDLTDYTYTNSTPLFDTIKDKKEKRFLNINFPDNGKYYFYKSFDSIQNNYHDIIHLQNQTGYKFFYDFLPDHESYQSEYNFSVFLQKYPHNFIHFAETIIKNHTTFKTKLKSPIHFLIKCSILSSRIDSYSQNYNHFYHEYINIAKKLETKDSKYKLYPDLTHFFKLDDRSVKIFQDILSKPQTPFINNFLYILPSVLERSKCSDFISQFKFNKTQEYYITLGILRAFGFWQDKSNALLDNKDILNTCLNTLKNLNFKSFHTLLLSSILDISEDLNEANVILNIEEKVHLIYNLNRFGRNILFQEFYNLFSKEDDFNLSLSNNICSLSLLNVSDVHKDVKYYIENFEIDKCMTTKFNETNYYYLPYFTYFSKHRSHQNYLFFKRLSNKYYRSNFNYVPS